MLSGPVALRHRHLFEIPLEVLDDSGTIPVKGWISCSTLSRLLGRGRRGDLFFDSIPCQFQLVFQVALHSAPQTPQAPANNPRHHGRGGGCRLDC